MELELFLWAVLGGIALVCVLSIFWPKRRNRRVTLPPPSDACKRRGPEAVP